MGPSRLHAQLLMNSTTDLIKPLVPAAPLTSQRCDSLSHFDVIGAEELCGSILHRWDSLRAGAQLTSPYFDSEFTRAVARVRDDVKIAIATRDEEIISFLPFQTVGSGKGFPVGGRLNDWHGVIGVMAGAISLS